MEDERKKNKLIIKELDVNALESSNQVDEKTSLLFSSEVNLISPKNGAPIDMDLIVKSSDRNLLSQRSSRRNVPINPLL